MNKLQIFLFEKRFRILLASLLLVLFGSLFVPVERQEIFQGLFVFVNVLIGGLLFSNSKKWRIILITLIAIILSFELLDLFSDWKITDILSRLLYIIFFCLISLKVYAEIYQSKEVDEEVIAAVFSGFIMLAIVGSFSFLMVELTTPNSFSNLGEGSDKYQNIQYFSFITTLTIGYGDIAPLTATAKKATMLMGILGNFYTVFVMGIIFGKFLRSRE